jgi:hypothetical protein
LRAGITLGWARSRQNMDQPILDVPAFTIQIMRVDFVSRLSETGRESVNMLSSAQDGGVIAGGAGGHGWFQCIGPLCTDVFALA